MSSDSKDLIAGDPQLFRDITELIRQSRQEAARQLNAQLTELYWQVGKRLSESVLGGERAAYGEQVIGSLSSELTTHYGRGWSAKQLHHCLRCAETFPDAETAPERGSPGAAATGHGTGTPGPGGQGRKRERGRR
jgi:uncharacterized protein DUF1016